MMKMWKIAKKKGKAKKRIYDVKDAVLCYNMKAKKRIYDVKDAVLCYNI